MRKNLLPLITSVLLATVLLTACSGALTASSWPGLTTDGTTAYLAHGTEVDAVKVGDGSIVWRYPEKVDAKLSYYAAPVLTKDNQLIIGDYVTTLTGLNAQTGVKNWAFTEATGRWIASPLVTDSLIYAPNADGTLYALDLTGHLKWKFKAGNALWSSPVTDGKVIYLPCMDQNLYALNKDTGEKIWAANLKGALLGSPVISEDGTIYTGTLNNELDAIKASDGTVLWKVTLKGGVWSGPLLYQDTLYLGDMSGNFYAISTKDQKTSWTYVTTGGIVSTPMIAADKVYFTNEVGALTTLDLTGKLISSRSIYEKLYSSPVLAGEKILIPFSGKDQLIVAVDQNGNQLWTFALPK
jgi:outer membrane protein assembly factor BamB